MKVRRKRPLGFPSTEHPSNFSALNNVCIGINYSVYPTMNELSSKFAVKL